MDALEALVTRVSPKEIGEPAPDEAALRKIFAAALRAPDHGRLRPWRFISIKGEGRHRLGELLASSLMRRDPNANLDLLERERQKALRAPLIVVVAAHISPSPKIPAVEQLLSAAAAAQNIMIASHALGFGAMWKTGEPAYDAHVKEALGLEAADEIAGFLYIGTRIAMPNPPAPLDPADFVRVWPAE
ncbi:MAG: nitroreductase [Rhodomicrobium sp.]